MIINPEHNLYIIKSYNEKGDSLIKFGYSSNIIRRINEYVGHNPFTELLHTFYRENALYIEFCFHKNNVSAFKNEWYYSDKLKDIISYINTDILYEGKESETKRKSLKYNKFIFIERKKCVSCLEIKERSNFNKESYSRYGLSKLCKNCNNLKNKKYRNKI